MCLLSWNASRVLHRTLTTTRPATGRNKYKVPYQCAPEGVKRLYWSYKV